MTSVLNVDTIADKAGSGPVALTKQDAAKFWTAYDAVADSVSGSFNQSSITDQSTGNHFFSFTNSFGSSTDKAAFANAWNTTNASSVDADGTRGGAQATIGGVTNFRALSASDVSVGTAYGSTGSSNGAAQDYKAVYCTIHGDLA
jgi:hypothetical protein